MDFLIDTLLGFGIAQLAHVLTRDKNSQASPEKFSRTFFFKDNWLKIVASLILSIGISILIHRHAGDVGSIFSVPLWMVFVATGAAPEFVLQILKDKFGLFQPKTVAIKTKEGTETNEKIFVRK